MADVNLPKTTEHDVIGVGCSYRKPAVAYDDRGQEILVFEHRTAGRGETISLTDGEARRLKDLGVVVAAGEGDSYDSKSVAELHDLAAERGLEVVGSGKNGAVVKDDLVAALEADDSK